jgi:hypothetical protein
VNVINADAYSKYLRDLVALIDHHLQTAGKGSFINPEMHLAISHDGRQ